MFSTKDNDGNIIDKIVGYLIVGTLVFGLGYLSGRQHEQSILHPKMVELSEKVLIYQNQRDELLTMFESSLKRMTNLALITSSFQSCQYSKATQEFKLWLTDCEEWSNNRFVEKKDVRRKRK
jgi:hypothetical protein